MPELPEVSMDTILAIVVITVSVLTAGYSYRISRNLAAQQQRFELNLYRFSTLSVARGKIAQLVGTISSRIDDAAEAIRRGEEGVALDLRDPETEVVITHQEISHLLAPDEQKAIADKRAELEEQLAAARRDPERRSPKTASPADLALGVLSYTKMLRETIDRQLNVVSTPVD